MNGGDTHKCTDCGGFFEVRFGTHPEYCPFCGHDEVCRA